MRFVVLLFGLAGVALTAFIGALYLMPAVLIDFIKDNQLLDKHLAKDVIEIVSATPTGMTHGDTGLFLLIAAGYGFLGTLLAFFRCGWQGALLMIIPVICTSIMNPYSAGFTFLLALGGLAAFAVFPLPINAPKSGGDDAEEDEVKPAKSKRKMDDDEEDEDEVKGKKAKRKVDDDDD